MDQHSIRQPRGAKHSRKRLGRGVSSGQGTYAGRGIKGQKARGSVRPGFEGGQIPMVRRLPRLRGFKNALRVEFTAVNLADLERVFDGGDTVDAAVLAERRLIDGAERPFKILGRGELTKSLTVVAPRLSASAKAAITEAGGSFEETAPAEKKVRNRVHLRRAAAEGGGSGEAAADAE
jgi:large subunit ribosomal protein L15